MCVCMHVFNLINAHVIFCKVKVYSTLLWYIYMWLLPFTQYVPYYIIIVQHYCIFITLCLSVQFSRSVVSNSLRPHELQHSRSPVHHQILESTQIHVHWVGDAIQPSHPLSSPSPPALNLSQHQGLFKWVSSSHQVAKVLEFQLQHQSFQWTPRTDLL